MNSIVNHLSAAYVKTIKFYLAVKITAVVESLSELGDMAVALVWRRST